VLKTITRLYYKETTASPSRGVNQMITALNLLISPSPQISDEVSLLKYLDYDLHLEDLLKWTQVRESLHIHIPKFEPPTDSLKFNEM
jgi:hypothetical protein